MNFKNLKHLETIKGKIPLKELEYLIENQDEVTEELLQVIDYTVENAGELAESSFILHIIAMYILAYFREKRAYRGIVAISNLPSDIVEPLLEDTITESLPGILASVFDGDLQPIKGIIQNRQCDEYIRRAAVRSSVALVGNEIITKESVIISFSENSMLTLGIESIESILEEEEFGQEERLISKDDVLSLSKWLEVF